MSLTPPRVCLLLQPQRRRGLPGRGRAGRAVGERREEEGVKASGVTSMGAKRLILCVCVYIFLIIYLTILC